MLSACFDRHPPDRPCGRRPPALEHGIHVGQDHQHLGLELSAQNRRHSILVHHGVYSLQAEEWILIHRRTTAACRDYHHVFTQQPLNDRELYHTERQRARCHPAPVTRAVLAHRAAGLPQPGCFGGRQRVPDRLGGLIQGRIVPVHQCLGDHGNDFALNPGGGERVLQRLLQHVPDPARCFRHQHAQRQRLRYLSCRLVAGQLVAHLGPVAVHDDDPPTLPGQLHDRSHTLTRMAELIGDRCRLVRTGQRIAAQC